MDGWTKGGTDVVCWSVSSFQHTIYPHKSPSLFPLPLPLYSFHLMMFLFSIVLCHFDVTEWCVKFVTKHCKVIVQLLPNTNFSSCRCLYRSIICKGTSISFTW